MATSTPPPGSVRASAIPGVHFGCLALFIAGFGLLYGGVIARLVVQWISDDNYSHGFIILPLALYFAWLRRGDLAAAPPQPAAAGLLVIAASLAVLAAGMIGAELFLTRISMLGVLAGTALFLWGWRHLWILAFPLSFLLLAIPLPAIVFNQIAFPLQMVASSVGETALAAAGVPVLRAGNILELPTTTLEVVEACSGIRSLVSLVTLAIVLAYFTEPRPAFRILLVLAAVPVAILANGARVAGTGLASQYWGASAAEGFFHGFSGSLVFLVALAALVGVQRSLRLVAPRAIAGTPGARRVSGESDEEVGCLPGR